MPEPIAFIVLRSDGTPLDDEKGRRFEFETRLHAEKWLMPGGRVQAVKRGEGVRPG